MRLRDWLARFAAGADRSRQRAVDAGELVRAGTEHQRAGRHDEACECFRRALALDPEQAAAYCGLGRALRAHGELPAAIENLRLALSVAPEDLDAAQEMSLALQQSGDDEQAEIYARRALELAPRSVGAQLRLADLLRRRGRLDEALDACSAAVALAPELAQAHNNLGNAYKDLGDGAQAMAAYRKALEIDPALAEVHFNLGIAVHEDGDVVLASAHYRAALALEPRFAEAHLNLGYASEQLGDPQGAIQCYRAAIALQPESAEAHFNLARQLLLAGDLAQGWQEYEWRWKLPEAAGTSQDALGPLWNGRALSGETILLYSEQGFGDVIQFARYAPLVARSGGKVVLQCSPRLKALFASLSGISAVLSHDEPLPEIDLCCPLLGLPRIFATTSVERIPASVPYLQADPGKARRWSERLAGAGTALRVGLVWASQPSSRYGRQRSLSLAQLAPLASVAGVSYHSLQLGAAAEEARRAPPGMQVADWSADQEDFSDAAALIANLDLVISVDTAVAHLAGAMGKRVWTLTSFPPDWRWLLGRTDSPWYPTMRLFRQRQRSEWTPVIAEVAQALREFAQTG